MQNADGTVEFHGYPFSQLIMTYLGMPALCLVSILLGAFLLITGSLTVGSAIVGTLFVLFSPVVFFLSAFGALMCSVIAVSDEGIAAHNFGRTLRFIRWEDVTKIKKVRRWNIASGSYLDTFYVFDRNFPPLRERMVNFRGPIAFSGEIRGLRDLLNRINDYSRRNNFLLVTLAQGLDGRSGTQMKLASRKRASPETDEIEVTAF